MLKVNNIKQGSEEWFTLRCGIPTASNYDKIVTSKGEPSKQATKYMYQLVAERITGKKEEGYTNSNMERGIIMEAEAKTLYEVINGVDIEQVALCYKDENKLFSCSPDGLIGEDGGIEIKCPTSHVHIEYLLTNKLPTTYFQQVQGCLMVTGRKWWDFMSYYPEIKPFIIRVYRDDGFIAALEVELNMFCKEVDIITNKIK